ncbi:MAG: putative Ig domain-containing protein, partial [Acidobacteriaceae bacterium]|nr:putative Ig domain-containing protein [Acidobacteriaceae bacterium]
MTRAIQVSVLAVLLTGVALAQVSINANSALDGAAFNVAYSVNLYPAGGTAPYTFSFAQGSTAPPGLTLSTAGILSGTPTTPGNYTFTVVVQDSGGASATKTFTLTVAANPLTLTPAAGALPAGMAFQLYQQQFTAAGGVGPYTYLLSPADTSQYLDIDRSSGLFFGTPTAPGTFSFSVVVIDSQNRIVSHAYTLLIQPATPLAVTNSCQTGPTSTTSPPIVAGAQYMLQFGATGGKIPYNFSSTNVPPGLALTAGGLLTGVLTPSSANYYEGQVGINLTVTDAAGSSTVQTCYINITYSPNTIANTSPLPPAVQNQPYSTTFYTSDPYNYYYITNSTSLPAGLSIDSGGTLAGVVTAAPGTYTFNITATCACESSGPTTQSYTLVVAAQALTITTASPLPTGYLDRAYEQAITGSETTTGTVTLIAGTLPPGLTLSGQSILGTPLMTGTYAFTLQLVALDGRIAQKAFTLTINASALGITTSSLPVGVVGASYVDILLAAASSGSPQLWSTATTLPSGITLGADGLLSGIPTTPGSTLVTFTLNGDNDTPVSKNLTLTIRGQALTITTATIPIGRPNVAYSATFNAVGGTGTYAWNLISGTLPSGFSVSSGGVLTGTATTTGVFPFTVQVYDLGDQTSATRSYTLVISNPLIQNPATPPNAVVNVAYPGATFSAMGGITPYTWTVFSGTFPPGLTLNSMTGVLSGTPTTVGTYTFTVRVTDSVGQFNDVEYQIIVATLLTVSTTTLPNGVVGTAYPATGLTASGGTSPYSWQITSGSLPPGLSLGSGAVIQGTPTTAGTYTFTAKVTDSGGQTAMKSLQIIVATALTQNPQTLPNGVVGVAYPGATLTATGGTPPYSWSLAGGSNPLPPGLSLSSTGAISGTPTTAGTYNFTAHVTDSGMQAVDATYQIVVVNQLQITTMSLPGGIVGTAYASTTLTASGGTTPYSWSIMSGSLPPGLSLSSTGSITGTPTTAGTYTITFKVT